MAVTRLTAADVDSCMKLVEAAGWNQTADDWRRMLALEPRGCFCVREGETAVATATVATYGADLAWIGMVLTHPEHRGRGHARALIGACLEYASGIRCVRLDATGMGRALYASFGFEDEYAVERWRGGPREGTPERVPTGMIDEAFDREIFGADRTRLLRTLGAPLRADQRAYAFVRPGRLATYIGPCVAEDPRHARRLIGAVRDAAIVDVPTPNANALSLLVELGFEPHRRLTRMRLGRPVPEHLEFIYGLAGFEFG